MSTFYLWWIVFGVVAALQFDHMMNQKFGHLLKEEEEELSLLAYIFDTITYLVKAIIVMPLLWFLIFMFMVLDYRYGPGMWETPIEELISQRIKEREEEE